MGHDAVVESEGLEDQGRNLLPAQKATVGKRGGGGPDPFRVARTVVVAGGERRARVAGKMRRGEPVTKSLP